MLGAGGDKHHVAVVEVLESLGGATFSLAGTLGVASASRLLHAFMYFREADHLRVRVPITLRG